MSYTEAQLLPISALEHFQFCPRQFALIHIERQWTDNVMTVQGRALHERTHEPGTEARGAVRLTRALRFRSLRLGLSGMADVVEWHRVEGDTVGVPLAGVGGRWRPYPVEYKRGKAHEERCYEVQLCAQALCLEEMLGLALPAGALYAGATHQRREVEFDEALRAETAAAAGRMHDLFAAGRTPPAEYGRKCRSCSLYELCLPKLCGGGHSVRAYLEQAFGGPPGAIL